MNADDYRRDPERLAWIERTVASLPPLTPAQIERLRQRFAAVVRRPT